MEYRNICLVGYMWLYVCVFYKIMKALLHGLLDFGLVGMVPMELRVKQLKVNYCSTLLMEMLQVTYTWDPVP